VASRGRQFNSVRQHRMARILAALLEILATLHIADVAQAAHYELGTPFPMTCVGILQSITGAEYHLTADDNHLNSNDDHDRICQQATIAEKSGKAALRYTLKDETVRRLLSICSLGKPCEISGQMNGLTHDVFFWVQIYSITGGSNIPQ
jgi:hypothetical protein